MNIQSTTLPVAILEQNVVALGKTGSGKSSALRILVEYMLMGSKPVCIIDPKGDWWGLRLSKDGKRQGFPIVVFGGKHADVPINEHAGAAVAELFATGARSCLIDMSEFMVGERTRFFMDFAATLFKKVDGPRHLVIDEVHNFAPQGKVLTPDAGKMLHWANRIASEGRGKGITMIAASQRPQKVHKDLLTSCETLIAMKVLHVLDRNAVKEWLDGAGNKELSRTIIDSIAQMKRGTGWVWSPEIEFGPVQVTFPMFSTYDSFAPPKARPSDTSGWAAIDLGEVSAKLAAVKAEADENDPKLLRKTIADLRSKLNGKTFSDPDPDLVQRTHDNAFAEGLRRGRDIRIEEVMSRFKMLKEDVAKLSQAIVQLGPLVKQPPPELARMGIVTKAERDALMAPASAVVREPSVQRIDNVTTSVAGGKRKMLTALAQFPQGLSAKRMGLLIGMVQSGTWRNYVGELRKAGFIQGGNEQFVITPAGLEALGDYEPMPTGGALLTYWQQRLGGKQRDIFTTLIREPNGMTADGLAKAVGMEQSGTWRNYIGEMRGLGLIVGTKHNLALSEELR